MLNQQPQQYNHKKFVNSRKIGDYANIQKFTDIYGKELRPHAVFEILRRMGVLKTKQCDRNVPFSQYMQYFVALDREYVKSDSSFFKPVYFITPEGQKYFADKINNYIEKVNFSVDAIKKTKKNKKSKCLLQQQSYVQPNVVINDNKEVSSPLDMDREQALKWLSELPEFLNNSYFAIEVRKKWDII